MAVLEEILRNRGETLVVHNHLQQQLTFVRGTGIVFYAVKDQGNLRKTLIDSIDRASRLKVQIKQMAIRLMKWGRVLLYLRPVGNGGYRIQNYPKDQYRCYYDATGDLESVVIIYSYKKRRPGEKARDAWIKIRITATTIERLESDAQPDFDIDPAPEASPTLSLMPNTLGFIPCVEALNPAPASEDEGISDFEPLRTRIEAHDDLTEAALDNTYFFATSPIITNREASEVSQALGLNDSPTKAIGSEESPSWAAGFRDPADVPLKVTGRKSRRNRRLKQVLGGFDATEDQIQQLQINALPANQTLYLDGYERQLRESLGGILERGIETATESRVVYGKVAATAREKQDALFTYGLCPLLEMAILAEESIFAASGGQEGIEAIDPDRSVAWRAGEVYAPTANDVNLRSITARNLMKFCGVSAREATKFVFPEKSEAELDGMVGDGGFPSDYLATAIQMFVQLAQTIDPLTQLPVTDPESGAPLYALLIPYIANNLQYGSQFQSSTPTSGNDGGPDPNAALLAALLARASAGSAASQSGGGPGRGAPVPGMGGLGAAAANGANATLPKPGSTVTDNSPNPFWDLSRSPILNAARNLFGA